MRDYLTGGMIQGGDSYARRELCVTETLGVFDPLGWLETEPEAFERRRAVERKHGRVAMAAVIGTIFHNNHIVFIG